MNGRNQRFFQELDKEIGHHPDKQKIMADYELHVYELLQEETIDEDHLYDEIVSRLGSPCEIAKVWEEDRSITPRKTQWLFVLVNSGFFIGGSLLTLSYHVFEWSWIDLVWVKLTEMPSIIMIAYILFWGLVGYEIGKEFGYGGSKLLRKTFLFAVIPNLLLMSLTIFQLIPHVWFQPLLSVPFIVACIVTTGFLYPISWIGYRWGRKISV